MAKRKKKAKAVTKTVPEALTWYFPTTDHGENDGFADSQLEYFQGDHERFIAREAIQNAVDGAFFTMAACYIKFWPQYFCVGKTANDPKRCRAVEMILYTYFTISAP